MTALANLYLRVVHKIEYGLGPILMPTLARFAFAALFAVYFWNSAVTKLGGSISGRWTPSFNAFAQIFPKGAEAAGYDITAASFFQKAIILAGTWAEFILPVLVIIGLFTRFAAIGMVGFILVMTLTDLFGHNVISDPATLGAWFDGNPGSVILDQRLLWIVLLLVPFFNGGGPLSVDALLKRRFEVS